MDSLEREAKERKKRMIALGSLPLCMAFFVWRLQTTTAAAPPPKPPPPPVVAQAAPVVAAAAGPVLSLAKQRIVEVPIGSRDPFIVAVATTAEPPQNMPPSGALVTIPPAKPMLITELGPSVTPLPPANPALNTFGTPPPVQPPSAAITTVPDAPVKPLPPPMPYVLCGIVKGMPDVAVLKHFDGSRRIVRAGDPLDRRFRLTTIDETSVVIDGGGETKTLRLGGDTTAPPAKK